MLSQVSVSHLNYSLSCERFEELQLYWSVLLVQCSWNFSEKLKFTEVFVLFQKFFLTWITTGEAEYPNKNGQCRVKKSKITPCIVSKVFLTWITTGGTDYPNKNGQCRVKRSETTLVLEIRSLHQRRAS